MSEKYISVPLEHYQTLANIAGDAMWTCEKYEYEALAEESTLEEKHPDVAYTYARLIRWKQWDDAAEERGLTR